MDRWLESALDYGLTEEQFWNMTLGEVIRAIEAAKRKYLREQRERASFDYILADLIGRSVARIYNSSNTLPSMGDTYPSLFDSEEIEAQQRAKKQELSALRFRQFALSHNKKFKGGSNEE